LTNNQFLDEQARLFSEHVEAIRRWGPRDDLMPEAQTIYFDETRNPDNDPLWRQYSCDQQSFFVRWRLGGMAGPYLPEPLEPDMLGRINPKFVEQFASAGSVFFLPDIVTLPSRDELRESIEHARDRCQKVEHLQGWFELIRSDSAARNQLDRLSRIFELQHYWRILHNRHATALIKSIGKLEIAFAEWFDVSPETIHGDLIYGSVSVSVKNGLIGLFPMVVATARRGWINSKRMLPQRQSGICSDSQQLMCPHIFMTQNLLEFSSQQLSRRSIEPIAGAPTKEYR
jgi:hypothetical protein